MTGRGIDRGEGEADRFIDRVAERDLSRLDAQSFDAADREFIANNPRVLDKLVDPIEFKKRYLYALFSVALALMVIAKVLEYTQVLDGHAVLRDLFTNVLFSIAIELLGATLVAFFLELIIERRLRHNKALLTELREAARASRHDGA